MVSLSGKGPIPPGQALYVEKKMQDEVAKQFKLFFHTCYMPDRPAHSTITEDFAIRRTTQKWKLLQIS